MAIQSVNTMINLNGLFKRTYAKDIVNVIPDNAFLTDMIPFEGSNDFGEALYIPINLATDQGITYASPGAGAAALRDSIAGYTAQARVDAYQLAGTATLDFETAARSLNAPNSGQFKKATKHIMEGLIMSVRKRLEINLLYGGSSVGTVDAASSGTSVILTAATYAPFIWMGSNGMDVDVYSSANAYKATIRVLGSDSNLRKLTVSVSGAVATGDLLYISGTVGNEAAGIDKILTTSGSLFGIDNSVYDLWKGNSYAVGGALSQAKLEYAYNLALEKGGSGKYVLLLNNRTWSDLSVEQSARINLAYNGSFNKKAEFGTNEIVYHTQDGGEITVKPHTLCMPGSAYLLKKETFKRVGCVDMKLGDPLGGDPIMLMPNNLGYRVLAYSHQALFCELPSNSVKLTGITNAS